MLFDIAHFNSCAVRVLGEEGEPSTSASDLVAIALGLTSGSDASSALGQYRCGVYDQ